MRSVNNNEFLIGFPDLDIKLIHPTGSRYVCNPPVMDTDEDFIVCVDNLAEFDSKIIGVGFVNTANDYDYGGDSDFNRYFASYKRDGLNIIATTNREIYWKFVTATNLAKRFNLICKQDRVELFRAILYGHYIDE